MQMNTVMEEYLNTDTKKKIRTSLKILLGTFNETEIKLIINRKELCSLYKCLLAFEPYIVYNKFIVRTDNTHV